ncbi:MAG: hypothetical protein EB075_14980, partial [Bacteroidetes bacterium]|nr:hypothetical protein [Bacteroidota bacterium]
WVYWDPRDAGKRLPGGDDWWKHYGMRRSPGDWDGTWADTSTDDPAGYDKQGVSEAAGRMLALREARKQGNVPTQLLEAAALFAITSKRTTSEKQEQIWGQVDAWLAGDERDPERLRAIMRPLGMQNSRLAEMQSVQANLESIRKVLLRHPTDGRAARRELMSGRMFKGLGMAKATFLLELMGYSDVACIDSVVANYLTGDKTPKRLSSLLSKKLDLYEAFEDALGRSQAYRESAKLSPLTNRAISEFAPGSTMKVPTAIAGALEGLAQQHCTCEGYVQYGNHKVGCWIWNMRGGAHGLLSLSQALQKSCNPYFNKIANMMGNDNLVAGCEKVGFGTKSGIRLPGESPGILPGSRAWRVANPGMTMTPVMG